MRIKESLALKRKAKKDTLISLRFGKLNLEKLGMKNSD